MVTPLEIWEWLGANSDALTSLVSVVAILLAVYVARRSPRWKYEAEYKINVIKDIFPALTTNIRNTINFYNRFLEGEMIYYEMFPILFDFFPSGQIEYIKIIDETLYDNLIRIRDEIYPLMVELQNERNLLKRNLVEKWENHINTFENINLNANRFADGVYDLINYRIWRQEYDEFLSACHEQLDAMIARSRRVRPPSDPQLIELRDIAEAEVIRIRGKVELTNGLIKEIITGVVIPRLEKNISDPF